ncbi:hypothetical protein BHM03_00058718 [Ensete ventricosum]|nr:hypothetical protein BHM03_00058718 [Ensete ventricosum]
MVEIWLPRLPRNEQFYPWAPLVAIEDSIVGDLYVELVTTFDLKHHTCNNLAVEEVIGATHIYKNGDVLLFKESSNFHHLWVGVAGQRVLCIVSRLGLFLRGFIFGFEALFRLVVVLILYWSNHEEPTLFAAMFSAPRFITVPTQPLGRLFTNSSLVNCFDAGTQIEVERAEGFSMADRGATLIVHTSWFNRSSWILTKEITAIRVYGCRAFTSP